MRFSLAAQSLSQTISITSLCAHLAVELGQSENFDHLASQLKAGLEKMHLEGCFLMSCFGFNRETRFGNWSHRYVFPLRSDLSQVKSSLVIRDGLIIISSGLFTLVVGEGAQRYSQSAVFKNNAQNKSDAEHNENDNLTCALLMLSESIRLWVKSYTQQVDQEFDSLNHRKASCKQLLEVVKQLDDSGRDITKTHNRVIKALNSGAPEGIAMLHLTKTQQALVLDEFDEIGRAYSIFTKQQMELHRELQEQVRSVAEFLLERDNKPISQ